MEIYARLERESPLARASVGTLRRIARGRRITKDEADYVDRAVDGERCGDCTMFVEPGACTLVKGGIAPNGHCRFWAGEVLKQDNPPRKITMTLEAKVLSPVKIWDGDYFEHNSRFYEAPTSSDTVKSSDHPGGVDLHVKPENAEPVHGIPVADVVTRANVQHVSWEMVREGRFEPRPARLALADLIATQQVVDRQRVAKHERELVDSGEVEENSPPLVLLWDGDYFLLGGHHGCQAAYNLGVKHVGVMLVVAPT